MGRAMSFLQGQGQMQCPGSGFAQRSPLLLQLAPACSGFANCLWWLLALTHRDCSQGSG